MREIYLWTEWFTELAERIAADDGKEFLMERAGRVENLRYGDLNVDPFSFVYNLASLGPQNKVQTYQEVVDAFEMRHTLPVDCDDAFLFPPFLAQDNFVLQPEGDSQLFWHLFRAAVHEPKNAGQHFDGALEIGGIAIEKLTQTLFLINPSAFLPYDDTTRSLGIHALQDAANWAHYQEGLQKFRDAFPGCAFYEINFFANLWSNEDMRKRDSHFFYYQARTDNWVGHRGDLWNGDDPQLGPFYFEPNNWVFVGEPKRGQSWNEYDETEHGRPSFPVDAPRPGEAILVRTGDNTGLGIGIVYKNDYRDRVAEDSRIHVVWVNKVVHENLRLRGLSRFCGAYLDQRYAAPEWTGTYALLDRLYGREKPEAIQGTPYKPGEKHPFNQILYGPPGTGKTYRTVDYALAIIDGVSAKDVKHDIERFHDLRFDANSGTGHVAMVTFHQNFAYEDFIEGIRPVLSDGVEGQIGYRLHNGIFKQIAEAARREGDKRFVLIIDEINRGNIAKIFGELITLVEESRRLGRDDETEVTLPYSNEAFGVPDNLYLIGTMNTADRSIQLLDTALRRRFAFVEMMPEPEHERISKDVDGVNCQEMLKVMNERITALLDREHQIGHTYLMDVNTMEELSGVFQNKIFPLLQEYFFDDWAKIRAVLGGNEFVSERDAPRLPADLEQGEDRKIYERLPSNDERWENSQQYRQIYAGDD